MHLVAWLSSFDPTYLSAWATATSAGISIALLVATIWLGRLTRVLAAETKLARLANERAQVDCSIQPHPSSISLQQLVMLNSGKSPAKEVQIKVTQGGHFVRSQYPVFPFTVLIPGERKEIFIGSYIQMTEKIFEATISYRDNAGNHVFTYKQDLSLWNDLMQVGQNSETEISNQLTKIQRVLDNWSSAGRLRVTTYTKRESEAEQREWREQVDAAQKLRETPQSAEADLGTIEPLQPDGGEPTIGA